MRKVKDGEWIRPVMSPETYMMVCCGCGLAHRIEFRIDPVRGFEMRGFRLDEAEQTKCDAS